MSLYPGRNSGTQQTLINSMNELLRITKQFHAVLNPKLGTVGLGPQTEAYRVALSNEDRVILNQIRTSLANIESAIYYETLASRPMMQIIYEYYTGTTPDNPSGNPNIFREIFYEAGGSGSPIYTKNYSWDANDNIVLIETYNF